MPKPICTVLDCTSTATRRGWCTLHYQRWRRHGSPLTFRPDATRGCSVEACLATHYGLGYCVIHWTRLKKTGDPMGLRPHFSPLAGRGGNLNPSWRGESVGYSGVHQRLQADPASNYGCAHCERAAEEWAYDHCDPDAQVSTDGLAYSVKGSRHYIPLCRSCHRSFDLGKETRARRA